LNKFLGDIYLSNIGFEFGATLLIKSNSYCPELSEVTLVTSKIIVLEEFSRTGEAINAFMASSFVL
jgi:hypothetical protein